MAPGPLLLIGGIVFLIGLVVTLTNIKNFTRRQRIIATPTSPIAQAPGNGIVEIKGHIVPSEQGLVQTPFSGRHAVWCRVTVQELRSAGRSRHWHTILSEVDGRPFLVDDGSGQMARVMPQGANVILDTQNVASSGTFNDAQHHLEHFLQSRGLKSTSWLGFNKDMRYAEEVLAPQDVLYALGPSRREAGPPVRDGYRMVPGTQLVMFHGMGSDGELILTNKSEDQLTNKLLTGFVVGLALAGLGLLVSVGGIVARVAAVL
jgi:E3 Ubiquitin ligase